jgi:hypothetical protein
MIKIGVTLKFSNHLYFISYLVVAGPGIEPGTRGFSVRCSTG